MSEEWSESTPWKVSTSTLVQFFTDTKRYISCPVCPHNGNWNFHVEMDVQPNSLDPYLLVYDVPVFSPVSIEKPKHHAGHFVLECPNCGHLEWIAVNSVSAYLRRKQMEKANG